MVTHDAVARAAVVLAEGRSLDEIWDVRMENAAYARFEARPGTWTLLDPLVNAHLAGLRADVGSQAL